MASSIGRAIRASSVAELFWADPDGAPDGCGVVALDWEGTPAVAFTYAREGIARAAAASPVVTLTLTDARSTDTAFESLALTGRPRMVEDVDGAVFTAALLDDELRRYPPSRKFADSAMLRREHWWYLPRLIVALDAVETGPLPPRTSPHEHVLAVAGSSTLEAAVMRVTDAPGPSGPLSLRATGAAPRSSGRAALLGQDATFPDLEQWAGWCFRGTYDGQRLRLTQPAPQTGLPPVPSMWQRAARQRALGRACRAGIRRAERRRR